MSRDLTTNLKADAQSLYFNFLVFVKLEFDSGTIYLHNGIGTYTWGGQNWLGVGDFGSIDKLEEGDDISPYKLTMILSGLDSDLMDEVMNQDFHLRPVTMYLGSLNSDLTLSDTPDEIWSGFMDTADVSLGNENSIRVVCESEMAIFDKSNNARFTDADLQREYSGDLFLQYLEEMIDATVVWRGTAAAKTYNPNPPVSQNWQNYGQDWSKY